MTGGQQQWPRQIYLQELLLCSALGVEVEAQQACCCVSCICCVDCWQLSPAR
jgi:hypothetical protein